MKKKTRANAGRGAQGEREHDETSFKGATLKERRSRGRPRIKLALKAACWHLEGLDGKGGPRPEHKRSWHLVVDMHDTLLIIS